MCGVPKVAEAAEQEWGAGAAQRPECPQPLQKPLQELKTLPEAGRGEGAQARRGAIQRVSLSLPGALPASPHHIHALLLATKLGVLCIPQASASTPLILLQEALLDCPEWVANRLPGPPEHRLIQPTLLTNYVWNATSSL